MTFFFEGEKGVLVSKEEERLDMEQVTGSPCHRSQRRRGFQEGEWSTLSKATEVTQSVGFGNQETTVSSVTAIVKV